MKSKFSILLVVILILISITSCSNNKSSSKQKNSISTTSNINLSTNNTTPSSTTITSTSSNNNNENSNLSSNTENNTAINQYKAILENKTAFFSTDNKKNRYLNDFLANNGIYSTTLTISHFTVLDMDSDGIPEVVLELSVSDSPQFYEVLHYMNGKVFGYLKTYRSLEMLKTDGTFISSGGALDNEYGTLLFNTSTSNINVLGDMQSKQSTTGTTVSYFINNKSVTKENFDSFAQKQDEKKDATWYDFTKNNIMNLENLISN